MGQAQVMPASQRASLISGEHHSHQKPAHLSPSPPRQSGGHFGNKSLSTRSAPFSDSRSGASATEPVAVPHAPQQPRQVKSHKNGSTTASAPPTSSLNAASYPQPQSSPGWKDSLSASGAATTSSAPGKPLPFLTPQPPPVPMVSSARGGPLDSSTSSGYAPGGLPSTSRPSASAATGLATVDNEALQVLRTELSMNLGELDCVASGFVSLETYQTIATTLANLSHVLIIQKNASFKNLAGVATSSLDAMPSTGAGGAGADDGYGRGSQSNALAQREQASALLELLSPSRSLGSRQLRAGGASAAGAAVAAAASATSGRGPEPPEWLRLQQRVMSFKIADHMQDPILSASATPRVSGAQGLNQPETSLAAGLDHEYSGSTETSHQGASQRAGDEGEARLTIDDLHAITEKDEVLHFFFRHVRKQMPELAKKLRVMAPSSVLEFCLLESAFKVEAGATKVSTTFEMQGLCKVGARTSPYSNFYLERMVNALPLSLSSLFSGGYLSPLEPVVAPYASCGHTQRENTEFFLSMEDRARLLQQHGITAYGSAELLLLHIGLLSNYASNILSSFSLFVMLACAKRLGDIRKLGSFEASAAGVPSAVPLDSEGIPLTVEGMEAFVEHCCTVFTEQCSEGLEQIRRQFPNVFILSSINASEREKAPVITIAVSTIVKLIYLFAGGISTISADDRRGTAVLFDELTAQSGTAVAKGARGGTGTRSTTSSNWATSQSSIRDANISQLSASTFAATGDPRGYASTRSATDATDDVALAAALRIASLSRLGMLSKLMGLDVTNSVDVACVATARACAAAWRVMFQFCGVLPYERCPTDMREWIHLFPLYAIDTPNKRALLHVHAMLSTGGEMELAPVMRERVLLSSSILLQKEMEKREREDAEAGSGEQQGEGGKSKKKPTAKTECGPSTVICPTFASHDRGLEQSHGHGACKEFYELCASEAVSEHLPPLDLLRYVDEPRPATAAEMAEVPGLAPYKHYLVVAFHWARAPVSRIHRGDDIAVQAVPRRTRTAAGTGVYKAFAAAVSAGGGGGSSDDDGEATAIPLLSLIGPNDNDLPLCAPLDDAVQERARRRSLFVGSPFGDSEVDAPPALKSANRSKNTVTTDGVLFAVRDASAAADHKSSKATRKGDGTSKRTSTSSMGSTSSSIAPSVPEQRLTVLAVVNGPSSSRSGAGGVGAADTSTSHVGRGASVGSLPMFVKNDQEDASAATASKVGPYSSVDSVQYVVFNTSAGSEGWSWATHRISSLTHYRRTRPPFRVAEDTAYAWTNPQYDMEADANRNANVAFTLGWLLGNTLTNEVVFQAPLAPLAFRLLARSIKYEIPIESLVLRPADLSLLGERWTAHVLEASLGHSEESIIEVFGLRTWQEEEDMDRTMGSGISAPRSVAATVTGRSRRSQALRRVVRAIANELCWNVQGDALMSRLFWSEVLRGLQATSLASAPLLSQCCARTVRTVLCGRMDSLDSNFSFREQFLLFFDMCNYHTTYHSALSKETVSCMDDDLTPTEKRGLLRFCTGRSLLPALPKTESLQIVFTEVEPLTTPSACDHALKRLPSSFTCDNVLVIPNYFCCLLMGTDSRFVKRQLHPSVQKDYGIAEGDFSTAWSLLSAAEREELCADYRALLGQRLRTAIYESGTLDDLENQRESSVPEWSEATRSHAGFRRSVVMNGGARLGAGSPTSSEPCGPMPVGASHTVVGGRVKRGASSAAAMPIGDIIDLLSGTLFDDVDDENMVMVDGVQLPNKAKAAAKSKQTPEAGDYYRLLVAHAKRMKAEDEEVERSMSAQSSSEHSQGSTGSDQVKPKRKANYGVLYNEDGVQKDANDDEWVPRKFLASSSDPTSPVEIKRVSIGAEPDSAGRASLVSPKRAVLSPKPEPTTRPTARTHTAASFSVPTTPTRSSGANAHANDAAAAAAAAVASAPKAVTSAKTSERNSLTVSAAKTDSKRTSATATLEDNLAAAVFIAQTEALVGRASGAAVSHHIHHNSIQDGVLIDATRLTPTDHSLDAVSHSESQSHPSIGTSADLGLATPVPKSSSEIVAATAVAAPPPPPPPLPAHTRASLEQSQQMKNDPVSEPADAAVVAGRVRKHMPPALRDLAARYDRLQRKSVAHHQQQQQSSDNPPQTTSSAPPLVDTAAALPLSPSESASRPQQVSVRRTSIDKAIDELFPNAIDF